MFGLLEALVKKRQELDAAEAEWLDDVAAYDRSGDWAADGFLNAAAAIRSVCRMNGGVARGHLDLARKLQHLPVVAEAFGAGAISRAHAVVVADAYTPERSAEIANIEPQLVAAAREHTPHQLGGLVRHVTDAIDGDGGARTDEAQHCRRGYYLSSTLDGMLVTNGTYDHVDGEIHKAAIRAEMQRDHLPHDSRTPAQRRADAHTNIMRRALNRGELGETHGVQPHISVVVDVDDLPGATPEVVARARGERHRDGYLSAATLELLTCDCTLSRIITAGRSEILDVGRATNTVTTAQWKALVTRDRHCQTPGCDRPPGDCHAHHITHWSRGGETNLDNLQLLCWHHHRQQHTHDAQARAA